MVASRAVSHSACREALACAPAGNPIPRGEGGGSSNFAAAATTAIRMIGETIRLHFRRARCSLGAPCGDWQSELRSLAPWSSKEKTLFVPFSLSGGSNPLVVLPNGRARQSSEEEMMGWRRLDEGDDRSSDLSRPDVGFGDTARPIPYVAYVLASMFIAYIPFLPISVSKVHQSSRFVEAKKGREKMVGAQAHSRTLRIWSDGKKTIRVRSLPYFEWEESTQFKFRPRFCFWKRRWLRKRRVGCWMVAATSAAGPPPRPAAWRLAREAKVLPDIDSGFSTTAKYRSLFLASLHNILPSTQR